MNELDALINSLKQVSNHYGLAIISTEELEKSIKHLERYKSMLQMEEKELDDNPNWRAGHPEKYGVRRN